MRKTCSTGIIFTGILLVALVTSYSDKDKPKETLPSKEATLETLKDTPQKREIITKKKKAISNESIESKAEEQQKQLPKIILIITSQACNCTLERCSKGEKIVNKVVQQFPEKLTFERLDHAIEPTLVAPLEREYQLHYLPALLFFDRKETFRGKLEAFWDEVAIREKLIELGLK